MNLYRFCSEWTGDKVRLIECLNKGLYGVRLFKIMEFSRVKWNTLPDNLIIVTAGLVSLCPNIPHQAGPDALQESFDRRPVKHMQAENLFRMAEFFCGITFSILTIRCFGNLRKRP